MTFCDCFKQPLENVTSCKGFHQPLERLCPELTVLATTQQVADDECALDGAPQSSPSCKGFHQPLKRAGPSCRFAPPSQASRAYVEAGRLRVLRTTTPAEREAPSALHPPTAHPPHPPWAKYPTNETAFEVDLAPLSTQESLVAQLWASDADGDGVLSRSAQRALSSGGSFLGSGRW